MKKILLLSAVLIGATMASQAGVVHDIGVGLRLPFLPRVVVRAPVLPIPAPAVICEAPRQVYVATPTVAVCPPAPVVRAPLLAPWPLAPVFRGEIRGWHGYPGRGWYQRDWHHHR